MHPDCSRRDRRADAWYTGRVRLASIHIHPVKACHRLDVDTAEVQPWGLAGDRRWIVADPTGRMVSQREAPVLATVRPVPDDRGGLVLRAPGRPELVVPAPAPDPARRVTVWGATVAATPAGAAAGAWFTAVVGRPVQLLWLDDPTRRPVRPPEGAPGDTVSFADAHPLLLTNLASLAALNGWLAESGSDEGPLPMTRFRPNLVVDGGDPWCEDDWLGRRIRVGAVTFRVVKRCGRCVVTTVDQETGVRGSEPLRVLARHRSVDGRLLFGVHLIPDAPYGRVAVGDPVVPDVG